MPPPYPLLAFQKLPLQPPAAIGANSGRQKYLLPFVCPTLLYSPYCVDINNGGVHVCVGVGGGGGGGYALNEFFGAN